MPLERRSKDQTARARELRRDVSKSEKRLWPHLRSSKTGAAFRRQHPAGPFYLDYYCAELKLAVEVDGPCHDRERDAARDAFLAARGIMVLRFGVQDVREQVDGVVERIRHEVWVLGERRRLGVGPENG